MPDTPQSLADRLKNEGDKVAGFFNQLTSDQWDSAVYQDGDIWSLHQLLAHVVSSEIGRGKLIAEIAAGETGAPPGFDIDAFNHQEVERLSGSTHDHLLELFSHHRSQLVDLVSTLETTDLERVGNDPFLGEVPLLEIIKLTYIHLQIHLRDARKRL